MVEASTSKPVVMAGRGRRDGNVERSGDRLAGGHRDEEARFAV